jgi:hypothetical protein
MLLNMLTMSQLAGGEVAASSLSCEYEAEEGICVGSHYSLTSVGTAPLASPVSSQHLRRLTSVAQDL